MTNKISIIYKNDATDNVMLLFSTVKTSMNIWTYFCHFLINEEKHITLIREILFHDCLICSLSYEINNWPQQSRMKRLIFGMKPLRKETDGLMNKLVNKNKATIIRLSIYQLRANLGVDCKHTWIWKKNVVSQSVFFIKWDVLQIFFRNNGFISSWNIC